MKHLVPYESTCQRLKEAGFGQERIYHARTAAPTLQEILKQLPETFRTSIVNGQGVEVDHVDSDFYLFFSGNGYHIGYSDFDDIYGLTSEPYSQHANPAEAAALLWLKLQSQS